MFLVQFTLLPEQDIGYWVPGMYSDGHMYATNLRLSDTGAAAISRCNEQRRCASYVTINKDDGAWAA